MLDFNRSFAVAKQIRAEKKACWYNALLAFFTNEDLQKGWYVEGWAIPDMEIHLNIEHGWIELEDGSIIDPTFAALGDKDVLYFPAIRYTYQEAAKRARGKRNVKLPFISQSNINVLTHPAYFEAYKASLKSATGRDYDTMMPHLEKAKQDRSEAA